MKKNRISIGCLLLLSSMAGAQTLTLDSLSWMGGCWELKVGNRIVEERWMKPAGQTMIGMGRTTSNGKTAFFEFMQVQQSDSGVYYIARPKGTRPTPFKLVELRAGEAVFENLLHDFPQRILYRSLRADSLYARVEGMVKGVRQMEEFPYKRVTCD